MLLDLITAPAVEPVGTADAKSHLRVDVADDDDLIDSLVMAAREWAEAFTRRALIDQTWELKLDHFPNSGVPIELAKPPLSSITSVTYIDAAGATQTWANSNYTVDAPSGPFATFGRLLPNFQTVYPSTRDVPNAVVIRYVAGYGSVASAIPEGIVRGLLMHVGHLYEHRESVVAGVSVAEVPQATEWLLWPYRALR